MRWKPNKLQYRFTRQILKKKNLFSRFRVANERTLHLVFLWILKLAVCSCVVVISKVCTLVLFAPFIEEVAKVFPLFYRHGKTERSLLDLEILVGVGFGVTEFTLYVFTLGAPVLSRIPGVFFHASSAAITAYGIAKKKPVQFYLIAVAFHLANNLLVLFSSEVPFMYMLAVIVMVAAYLLAWRLYRRTSETIVL